MKKFSSCILAIVASASMLLATGCTDPKPTDPVIGTPELALTVKSTEQTAATITAAVKNTVLVRYTHYEKGNRPVEAEIKWKDQAVAKDGSYDLPVAELAAGVEYTLEATALAVDLKSATKTIDFKTTTVSSVIEVTKLVAGHNKITFSASFDKANCDGFFYAVTPTLEYNEKTFLDNCKPGGDFGQVFNHHATESADLYANYATSIKYKTQYTVAVVGAKLNTEGVWTEFVGTVFTQNVTSKEIEFGLATNKLTLAIDKAKITFGGVEAQVSRKAGDGTDGYYCGAIEKSKVSTTLEAAVSAWLLESAPNSFGGEINLEMPRPYFEDVYLADVKLDKLKENTDYVIFALAYDKMGLLGQIVSEEIKTGSPVFNSEIGVDIIVTEGVNRCSLAFAWMAGYDGAYISRQNDLTADEVIEALMQRKLNNEPFDWTSEQNSAALEYLVPGQAHSFYVLCVKADGSFSKMQEIEFSTLPIAFTGAARVTANVASVTRNPDTFMLDLAIDFVYSAGAVACEYVSVWIEPGTTKTPTELATQMYESGVPFISVSATNTILSVDEMEVGNQVVYVPYSNDGKRGTPVSITIEAPKE